MPQRDSSVVVFGPRLLYEPYQCCLCLIRNCSMRVQDPTSVFKASFMRVVTSSLLVSLVLFGTFCHASDRTDIVKVKTGILPNGGFYSLYEVDCRDQGTAEIASLNGKRRWCALLRGGTLSCSSSQQDVTSRACVSSAVAAAGKHMDGIDKYQ
jgi:hypothetical protein